MNKKIFFFTFFIMLASIFYYFYSNKFFKKKEKIIFAIHAGVGNNFNINEKSIIEKKLQEALQEGYKVLKEGKNSLCAVESAIKILEDSLIFNAGIGSVHTAQKTIEMDASIMEGKYLCAGAVTNVKCIKNPINMARLVMEKTKNVMLCADGVIYLAQELGVKLLESCVASKPKIDNFFGTVGAVGIDIHGDLAAGTSTGGLMNKRIGRVADSSIIGAGTYANNEGCAVSCSGEGEFFIRLCLAHDLNCLLKYKKLKIDKAAKIVIQKLTKMGGKGGLISLDKDGNLVMEFNTNIMLRGYITENGKSKILIS